MTKSLHITVVARKLFCLYDVPDVDDYTGSTLVGVVAGTAVAVVITTAIIVIVAVIVVLRSASLACIYYNCR